MQSAAVLPSHPLQASLHQTQVATFKYPFATHAQAFDLSLALPPRPEQVVQVVALVQAEQLELQADAHGVVGPVG